jgi:hypothetical protein
LAYFVQVFRIAFSRGPTRSQSWIYALFIMLAKPAEFLGILKFWWRKLHGQPATLIEYR